MTITLDLPEDIANDLATQVPDLSQLALESVALEGYRSGGLSEEQVRRMLDFESRWDVHAFLKQHGVQLNYSLQNLQEDLMKSLGPGK